MNMVLVGRFLAETQKGSRKNWITKDLQVFLIQQLVYVFTARVMITRTHLITPPNVFTKSVATVKQGIPAK